MGDHQLNLAVDQGATPLMSQNREHAGCQASPGILEWVSTNKTYGLSDTGQAWRTQMELAFIRSTTLERAMLRLRAIMAISLPTAEAATVDAPVDWRSSPTIARDRGDYLLHIIMGR